MPINHVSFGWRATLRSRIQAKGVQPSLSRSHAKVAHRTAQREGGPARDRESYCWQATVAALHIPAAEVDHTSYDESFGWQANLRALPLPHGVRLSCKARQTRSTHR